MQLYSHDNISWYQFEHFQKFPNLVQAVTTRGSHHSPFSIRLSSPGGLENRQHICQILGIPHQHLVVANQVHGHNITVVTEKERGRGAVSHATAIPESDGLFTFAPQVPLLALSADCPLVALFAPKIGAIAVVHAGWRGTVQEITYLAVQKLCNEYHCDPKQIWAGIAPSIGPCCYEVGLEVIEECKKVQDGETWCELQENGKWHLNLWKANQNQLLRAGILSENIEVANLCTMCNWELFFSYRLDGKATGHIGLFMYLKY